MRDHVTRARATAFLETLLQDLRYAVRGLRRSPGFALVAALSIALGVAANATVFSIVNAVLLRPIPGATSDGLVRVYVNHHSPFDRRDLVWLRDRATSFRDIVGESYNALAFRAASGADAERVHVSYVTRGFFRALGVRMALGRTFDAAEDSAGGAPVAVLSYGMWQRRFAGDSAVVGRTIHVAEHPVTIIGVSSPDFRSSVWGWTPDFWLPASIVPMLTGIAPESFGGSFYTTARLQHDVTQGAAAAELRVLMQQLARTDSVRYDGMTVRLDDVRGVNAELRGGVSAVSAFLMFMVALVLLIACANVANLLLGRAAARRQELGVRLAIGASRGRLIRQLLTESAVLAALGSAAGFAATWALTRVLPAMLPAEARLDPAFFAPDHRVVEFTAVLCLATTVLFGAAPAVRAASPHLVGLLKGDDGPRRRRRGALVAGQAAVCVLMLAVASIFLRSLASMRTVDPGFRSDGVVDVSLDLGLLGGGDPASTFATLAKTASTLPGVRAATLAAVVPLTGSNMETRVAPEDMHVATRHDVPSTYFNIVAPKYFETLSISLLRGREFLDTDAAGAPRVAVINETAARRWWPAGNALGKRLHFGAVDGPLVEVVGIVRDANLIMPGETPGPMVYVPLAQEQRRDMTLQLRTSADIATVRRAVWDMLRDIAPTLPPPPVVRMVDDMTVTLLPVRLGATLLGAFGLLALVLAATGIYGVTAYSVARRTREMGVRAALGASRTRLTRMVIWESMRTVAIGSAIGLVLAIAAGTALSRVLYGARPIDPVVLLVVLGVVAAAALVASFVPAGRAAGIDPVTAMRAD